MMKWLPIFFALTVVSHAVGEEKSVTPEKKVSFVDDIKPILTERCSHCHNRKTLTRQVSFENRQLAFAANYLGQLYFNPGNPEQSLIMTSLTAPIFHDKKMPMVGKGPTPKEIELIRLWIKQGCEWPKGPQGKIVPPFYAKE